MQKKRKRVERVFGTGERGETSKRKELGKETTEADRREIISLLGQEDRDW